MEDFQIIQRNHKKPIADLRRRYQSTQSGKLTPEEIWSAYDENVSYRLATVPDDPDNALKVVDYNTKSRTVVSVIATLFADTEDDSQEPSESVTEDTTPETAPETPETAPETSTETSESVTEVPTETAPVASRYVLLLTLKSPTAGTGVTSSPDAPELIAHKDAAGWHVSSGDQQTISAGLEDAARAMANMLGITEGPARINFEYMEWPLDFNV